MKRASVVLIAFLLISTGFGAMSTQVVRAVSGEDARQKLLVGNKRYVHGKLLHPNQTLNRRMEVASGQHPFAAILSCSDSRVPPEIIFDQGLGAIFVIRLAGNIRDDAVLGSLEYAVEHLGVKYIMVLGHERCGAVDAAVKGGKTPGHLDSLVKAIQPAVEGARNLPGDVLDNAVRANVRMVVQQLKSAGPILEESVKKGALTIDGARYDLDDGAVTILP